MLEAAGLQLDERNANKGTERGLGMLEHSLRTYGAGRSGLADRQGRVVAGNKTVERAIALGIPIRVIETDGRQLVVLKRTDLDLDTPEGRGLAIADNRVGEVDLEWDPAVLAALQGEGVPLEQFWYPDEVQAMIAAAVPLDGAEAPESEEQPLPQRKATETNKMLFSTEAIEQRIVADWPQPASAEEVAAGLITPGMAMGQFNKLASGARTGYYISALFNPQRLTTATKQGHGYVAACQSSNFRNMGAKFLVRWKLGDMHPRAFPVQALVGWGGVQLCNEFRPYVARDVYLKYCPKGGRVLDPCHGWGGRVIGWLAADLGGFYLGFDPAPRTSDGLLRLIDFLKQSATTSDASAVCAPFEDVPLSDAEDHIGIARGMFDLVFTSPPYFDTELYEGGEQAHERYESWEEWLAGFFRPLLEKSAEALKPGGSIVLNLGRGRYPIHEEFERWAQEEGWAFEQDSSFFLGDGGELHREQSENADIRPPESFYVARKPLE